MYPLEALKAMLLPMNDRERRNYLAEMEDVCCQMRHLTQQKIAEEKFPVGSRVWMDNEHLFIGVVKEIGKRGVLSILWDGYKYNEEYETTDICPIDSVEQLLKDYYPISSKITINYYGLPEAVGIVEGYEITNVYVKLCVKWDGNNPKRKAGIKTHYPEEFWLGWCSNFKFDGHKSERINQ